MRDSRGVSRRQALAWGAVAMMMAGEAGRSKGQAATRAKALVFAHRGCSALRPEHTLGAYAKAIADGADYIEPDLVVTKDGILVVRHENEIGGTTDVAGRPEFSGRKTTKTVDGQTLTGWFTEDFTLAELKTLRAIERLGAVRPESKSYDGQFQLLTFDEVIDFAAAEAAARGRSIGLVPELKHSTYFGKIGLPLEDRFLAALGAHPYTQRHPVEVQSFEIANLRYLRERFGKPANVTLLQLIDDPATRPADVTAAGGKTTYGEMLTAGGLAQIATYADVVGPSTRAIIPLRADGRLGEPTAVVRDAHAAGLLVRPYTFRPENRFLPADFRDGAGENARNVKGSEAEIGRYLAAGIDGFFTDDPAIGRRVVDAQG